jgi:hypothetical protein
MQMGQFSYSRRLERTGICTWASKATTSSKGFHTLNNYKQTHILYMVLCTQCCVFSLQVKNIPHEGVTNVRAYIIGTFGLAAKITTEIYKIISVYQIRSTQISFV